MSLCTEESLYGLRLPAAWSKTEKNWRPCHSQRSWWEGHPDISHYIIMSVARELNLTVTRCWCRKPLKFSILVSNRLKSFRLCLFARVCYLFSCRTQNTWGFTTSSSSSFSSCSRQSTGVETIMMRIDSLFLMEHQFVFVLTHAVRIKCQRKWYIKLQWKVTCIYFFNLCFHLLEVTVCGETDRGN